MEEITLVTSSLMKKKMNKEFDVNILSQLWKHLLHWYTNLRKFLLLEVGLINQSPSCFSKSKLETKFEQKN